MTNLLTVLDYLSSRLAELSVKSRRAEGGTLAVFPGNDYTESAV
jgi:hypothetical protein